LFCRPLYPRYTLMFSLHLHLLAYEPQPPNPHGVACPRRRVALAMRLRGIRFSSTPNFFKFISGIGALLAALFCKRNQAQTGSIPQSRTILCRGRMAMQLTVNQPHGGSIPPDTASWVASIMAMCLPFKQNHLSSNLRRPTISPYSLIDKALLS
jgi:hypothetical protein